ncbi:NADH:ubiquinone oxidoreductase subunit NDUFA12 [Ferrovibrio sp.]|uniref:NADH:ubiquinone oxidoreductase subunit NDUFA12 n=1 Tax=Ferrovibrio sp. TaxID=1917215 RepID=UPI00311E376C
MSLLGTKLFTWWKGELVGKDQFGNRYFREKGGRRRWVIFKGLPEASKVPPEWHAWLHHTVDDAPVHGVEHKPWEKEHLPNLSGTPFAYRPQGSVAKGGERPHATGDYQAWQPE